MLMLILLIIAIIGITFTITFFDKILKIITNVVSEIRTFLWENKSLIDILFLLTYVSIQLTFLFKINKPNANTNLVFTVFTIALLATLGIERIFLVARSSYSNKISSRIFTDYKVVKNHPSEMGGMICDSVHLVVFDARNFTN